MKSEKKFFFLLAPLAIAFLSTSCVSRYSSIGSLENYALLGEGRYFKQEYVNSKIDLSKYKKIKLNPVNLDFFDRVAKFHLGFGETEKLSSLLEAAFKEQLEKKYLVLAPDEKPDEQTLTVEPALLYARKPSPLLNVLTIIPFRFGTVAFEVKVSDGKTGKVMAQAAEQRKGPTDLKSIFTSPYTKHEYARAIFKKWAKNLLTLLEIH